MIIVDRRVAPKLFAMTEDAGATVSQLCRCRVDKRSDH